MKRVDVVVVGAGDVGLGIAFKAASKNLKVALIDKGQVGGTCVNYGCVPSKTLIHTADRIAEIREAEKLGVRAPIIDIDFQAVMKRMRTAVTSGREGIEKALEESETIDFIRGEAQFIDDHTLTAGDQKIKGKKIFIASGAAPSIPLIKGLDQVPYLTNVNVLDLPKRPESMLIIGGGFVGLEYAHFFSVMGTRVFMIHRHSTLLPFEEPEISELLKEEVEKYTTLFLNFDITGVKPGNGGCIALVRNLSTGEEKEVSAETLFVAGGRKSNAELLKVENAGLETDEKNFIKTDETLQTSQKHIWALGDAVGRAMFTHAGDKEAELAWHNATHRKKIKMDFASVPHAVFTNPQIASVGLTEAQARRNHEILVGRANYSDTVMGEAMMEQKGLAKAVVEKGSGKILGFHIIGPHAAMLIQEVVNAIVNQDDLKSITDCMHIFPALSNLIPEALGNLE
jgi:mycothione reductase